MKFFFILIFLLSFLYGFDNKPAYGQNRIQESFESNQFPPEGWSTINFPSGESNWQNSTRVSNTGRKCAVSNFSSAAGSNILVSKRFIPVTGDSLVFNFRQTFWNIFKDTFIVSISAADSLLTGANTVLFRFYDGTSYPVPFSYERYAVSLNAFAGQTVWLGFQHINLNGDNIRLDDITVGQPGFSDVGIEANISPEGIIRVCNSEFLLPKAVVKNYGTVNLSIPFNITYEISGMANYTCTIQDTLFSGYSKIISFDTLNINIPGNYNVKIYTGLNEDQNIINDTLKLFFSVVNPNFGGGQSVNGNYYFANSTLCSSPSPSHPEFCWKDTSGSINLILEDKEVSGGLLTGNIDNGYFSLGSLSDNDNKIKFFDTEYDSVFISTNGMIGFVRDDLLLAADHSLVQDLIAQPVPLIAPLWMDLDFNNAAVTGSRLCYKFTARQLIITYTNAPLKNGGEHDFVSFQLCIELGIALPENSKLLMQYNYNSTGENFISNYINNTLPFHLIGIKGIETDKNIIYRAKDSSGTSEDGAFLDSSVALVFGNDNASLNNKCSQLDITVLLEAIYPMTDTITVLLRNAVSPFQILESKKMYPDSSGFNSLTFTIPEDQLKYYLVVKHRNSIETWSKESGESFTSNVLSYDFTTDKSKAFGNNMLMRNDKSYIYCGDVNQDNIVDGDDIINVYNYSNNFSEGYISEDLNRDEVVDLDDIIYVHNNSSNFVMVNTP